MIFDLLFFIQNDILQADPSERASCREIEAKLTEIQSFCNENDGYCTERKKKPPPRRTTDKSTEVSVPLSPRQREEYAKATKSQLLRPPLSTVSSRDGTSRDESQNSSQVGDDGDEGSHGRGLTTFKSEHTMGDDNPIISSRTPSPALRLTFRKRIKFKARQFLRKIFKSR